MLKHIGKYQIIEELGRGEMGVVYLAKHPSPGIDVAIKVMFPDPSRTKNDHALVYEMNNPAKSSRISMQNHSEKSISIIFSDRSCISS